MRQIDWEIINELNNNSRIQIAQLAKTLKKDRHIVSYYKDALFKSNTIKSSGIDLNYSLLGFQSFVVYLNLFQYREIKDKLIEYIKNHPNAVWAAEIFPEYGLRILFLAKDLDDFEKIYEELEDECDGRIINKEFLFQKEFLKYANHSTNINEKKIKEVPGGIKLKDPEIKLIKALFQDSSQGLLQLSNKTGLSIEGIRKKIKQFREIGLIKTNVQVDKKKVGTNFWAILVLRVDHLLNNLDGLKNILKSSRFGRTRKMFGSWNIETTLLVENHDELIDIVDDLEKLFKKDLDKYKLFITSELILPFRLPKILFEG